MQPFFKRHWPLIGLGILLALVAAYLIRSGKDIFRNTTLEKVISGEGIKLKDIHYTQDDPEKGMKWVLDAGEVKFSGDRQFISFHDFKLKVSPARRPSFVVTGNDGDYSRATGELNLRGDLKGTSEDGYRVVTESVRFDEKKGILTNDKPVQIWGPFFSIKGEGIFVDLRRKSFKVLSRVTTVINGRSGTR
ncbi:MAG: LPS export ABC transporter periplasmic protein LptC [Desulfatiglandaceae bacterium]|jgi:LPS export ABC transporter protein LptC